MVLVICVWLGWKYPAVTHTLRERERERDGGFVGYEMSAEEFVPTNERLLRYSLGHKPITLFAVLDPCSPYVCWTKRIPACCLTGLHV